MRRTERGGLVVVVVGGGKEGRCRPRPHLTHETESARPHVLCKRVAYPA